MFQYKEYKPSASLAPFVKCFWTIESDLQVDVTDKILPDGCIEMIFHFGEQFVKNKTLQEERVPRFFVNGQNTQPFTLSPTGQAAVLGVRFYPVGAWPILHVAMAEITDRFVPLDELYGLRAKLLTERMYNEKCWARRIELADEFLVNELGRSTWSIDPVINRLVRNVYEDKSKLNLARFAKEMKYSERQIRRKFLDVVGINPSIFVRVVRFREVFKLRKHYNEHELLGLAIDSGYHDQSHFIRDFKKFTGETPTQYFKTQHALSGNFV